MLIIPIQVYLKVLSFSVPPLTHELLMNIYVDTKHQNHWQVPTQTEIKL